MASSKYIKAPMSSDIRRYTEEELRKLELSIASLMTPPTWTPVTFQNGWVNFGAYQGVQYCKDSEGFVHIRGLAKNGTFAAYPNVPMFTLPVGFRPPLPIYFLVGAGTKFSRIDVFDDGRVNPIDIGTGATNAEINTSIVFSIGV